MNCQYSVQCLYLTSYPGVVMILVNLYNFSIFYWISIEITICLCSLLLTNCLSCTNETKDWIFFDNVLIKWKKAVSNWVTLIVNDEWIEESRILYTQHSCIGWWILKFLKFKMAISMTKKLCYFWNCFTLLVINWILEKCFVNRKNLHFSAKYYWTFEL